MPRRLPGRPSARRSRLKHLAFALLALAALALLGLYVWLFAGLPAPDALVTRASAGTTKIYDRHGQLLYEILDPRTGSRTRIPLDDIPLHLQQATVATEDATFYDNPGISPKAILRALYLNTREGEIVSGGSTITQQVARLVLMTPQERIQQTMTRKLREALLALRLSLAYDKETLLGMYLNEVYYGNLTYGVEAAAQAYFGVHARDLDLAQCALLAGLPQAPVGYDPLLHLDAAKDRQRVVLDLMVKQGFITQQEADQAYTEPLHLTGPDDALLAPHFVAYVRGQLEQALGREALLDGGWTVTTTLDLDLQQRAEAIVQRRLAEIEQHEATSAALVALDPVTGEILAMVGSADYGDAGIDGAVNGATALRQPGSAMKPILYAAAFESGDWTPASVVYDVRTTFITDEGETYVPVNADHVYHGPVTLREALANSYNLPAVILQKQVGTDVFLDTARDFGLTTLRGTRRGARRYGLSLTLGGGEVTLLDLTGAYAVFASGGVYRQPTAIVEIAQVPDTGIATLPEMVSQTDCSSADTVDNKCQAPLISPQVAYLVTHILSDNDARVPAFGFNSPLRLSRPAAAKTGTTTNWRDNWTMGYTPDLVVGVWVGNASGAPMRHVSGVSGAGPIWHDFMEAAHHGLPVRDFVVPDGLVWRDICPLSGQLAGPDCPYARREVFIAGTEPQIECDQHVRVAVDRRTGEPATAETPSDAVIGDGVIGDAVIGDAIVERVYWVPPPELREWARERGIPQLPSQQTSEPADSSTCQLALTSPDPNAVFALASFIPHDHQRIEVKAEVYTPTWPQHVTLYADGEVLAVLDAPPYRALWTLEGGEHTFYALARDRDGSALRSEPITIQVEAEAEEE